jgi:hypothetical protein
MHRTWIAAVLAGLAWGSSAWATPYAGEFLTMGIGARALGMGGAFVGVVDDASATYWNPAALPRCERREVTYMHAEQFSDLVNYDSAALVLRPREDSSGARSAFGLGFIMLSVPGIMFTTTDPDILQQIESGADGDPDVIDADGTQGNGKWEYEEGETLDIDRLNSTANEVTDRQMAFFLSYGRSKVFTDPLSFGGSVKFVRKSIDEYSAWGIGLDVAALYQIRPQWTVALNLRDATTTFLDWSNTPTEEREYITPTAKLGTAYRADIEALRGSITGAMDFDFRFEDEGESSTFGAGPVSADVRLGVEYFYKKVFAVRLGTERLNDDSNPFTAGAGLRIKSLSFDYAYRNHADLEETHRISGGVLF